jgi:hypothetical protein
MRPARKFLDALAQHGWTNISTWQHQYAKGDWKILFDTSSWLIVEAKGNPRVPDVEVTREADTDEAVATWTVRLIEHLCALEDERQRLRRSLERVRDAADAAAAHALAASALNAVPSGAFDVAATHVSSRIVEHLGAMATEHRRLARALEEIRDGAGPAAPNAIARQALAACYHTWLVDDVLGADQTKQLCCAICGQRQPST